MAVVPTQAEKDQGYKLLDDLTFGGHSQDGAASVLTYALACARETVAEKVRKIHAPWGIYTECGHEHTEAELEDEASSVHEVDLVGLVCKDGLMYRVCRSCCVEPGWAEGFQTETCATKHLHTPDGPVCPTVAVLDGVDMPGEPWT